MVGLLQHPTAR